MAALNITTNIVTSIVTVPGFGFTADSIEGGHDLYQQALSLSAEIPSSCDAQTCDHLTNSISAELDAIEGQLVESGYDRSHIDSFIDHLEASVKQTITLLADDENALREAILKPEVFRYYVLAQSASARQNYTPGELHHLDTLLGSVAQEYLTLAPASPDFKHTALERTITALTQISHQQTTKDPTHSTDEDPLSRLAERSNLADTYVQTGRLDEAITLYEQILEDYARVLGENHPQTLSACNDLATCYQEAGRLDEAITLFEQVITDSIRIFGDDHPNTLTLRNNLANCHLQAGRFVEAIALYEQAAAGRARVLGDNHSLTLSTRNSLADAYESAGRRIEAIQLFEQVAAGRARVLGEDHPLTLSTRNNLAYTYNAVEIGRAHV